MNGGRCKAIARLVYGEVGAKRSDSRKDQRYARGENGGHVCLGLRSKYQAFKKRVHTRHLRTQ